MSRMGEAAYEREQLMFNDYDPDEEAYCAAAEADLERRMEEAYANQIVSVKITRDQLADLAEMVDRELDLRNLQRDSWALDGDTEGVSWAEERIKELTDLAARL